MLFDRRLGHPGPELSDIGGYGYGPHSFQPEGSLLAPTKEFPDGQSVGHPRVAVSYVCLELFHGNTGGEELNEALACLRPRP